MQNHGGAEGGRTPDLVNAIHALSQLSYSPAAKQIGIELLKIANSVIRIKLPLIEESKDEP